MTFTESVKTCYQKYFTLSGRASRSEYWWFQLFGFVLAAILILLLSPIFGGHVLGNPTAENVLSLILLFAFAIPQITVTVRRLHDIGRSGWWYLIQLVPILGTLVIFIFCVMKSKEPETDGSVGQ